ncbi:MAG TPA: MBL fold metallo-hydrolase [Bacilli bacterium]|nr:MBL fold metallo-hydrolase [Bacilli bacterium]
MKFCVLASGSKGNCTYIEIDNHKYLIDIGMNFLYVSNKLKEIEVDPSEIEGIFITHIHEDHIAGLKRFIKVYNPIVYLTQKIYDNINIEINNYHFIEEDEIINDNLVETIKLSHDTPECKGYIFNYENTSLVYITDTGYINQKYFEKLSNRTAYIIESNHDIDMIMNGSRPYYLKMRVIGDEGHISNKDCLYYLTKFVGNNTKQIVLAHISHDNNDHDLALNNIKDNINVENVIVAEQNERLEVIELCSKSYV